jgi:hypothetical protein
VAGIALRVCFVAQDVLVEYIGFGMRDVAGRTVERGRLRVVEFVVEVVVKALARDVVRMTLQTVTIGKRMA